MIRMTIALQGELQILILLVLTSMNVCVPAKPEMVQIGVLYNTNLSPCFGRHMISHSLSMHDVKTIVHWKAVSHTNDIVITKDVCELVEKGITGLVTLLTPGQQEVVNIHTRARNITHLPIDTQPVSIVPQPSIQIPPPLSTQAQLIKDLLSDLNWAKVIIIFDGIIDKGDRELLMRYMDDGQRDITAITASLTSRNTVKLKPDINMIPVPNYSHFVFLGRGEIWTRFIYSRLDLLSDFSYWFVISDVSPAQLSGIVENIPVCNVVISMEAWRSCLFVNTEEALDKITSNMTSYTLMDTVLAKSLRALTDVLSPVITTPNVTCSRYVRPSPSLPTEPWKIYLAEGSVAPVTYQLYGTYSNKHTQVESVGEWRAETGIKTERRSLFLNTFHQFNRDPVLIACTESPPFIIRVKEGGVMSFVGFSVDLMDEIAARMGFNYTLVEPPDDFFGAQNPDGTWNGMVGMVYRGDADMAIGPFTISSLREQVIDFTVPFSESSTGILTLSPGFKENKSLFQTLKPFSVVVWLITLAAVFFVGFMSFLVNHYTPYGQEKGKQPFQAKYESSLTDNMWMVYSSVTEQGIHYSPKAVSGRCVLGLWWVFTILLVATYTANLAAFLVASVPPPAINSLGELLAQDKIQPIIQTASSFETVFKEAKTDLYRKTWERIQKSPRAPTHSDVLRHVQTGHYAYIGDQPLLNYFASNSCQKFMMADERFDTVGFGMVIPEKAPYARTINHLIRKMQEGGLMGKWKQKWWAPSSLCPDTSENSIRSLDLDSLGGIFISYVGIIFLAFLYLAVAYLTHLRYRKYEPSLNTQKDFG